MPHRRQATAALAVFILFVVYDWLYWEVMFTKLSSTPVSWLWFHGASAVMAVCFVSLFERGWTGAGVRGGLRFGIVAGVFWSVSEFMAYAIEPSSLSTTFGNAVGDVGMCALAGTLIGAMYRESADRAA